MSAPARTPAVRELTYLNAIVEAQREEMLRSGIGQAQIDAIERDVATEVADAVTFARESPLPDPDEVYDYLFSNPIHYPPEPAP